MVTRQYANRATDAKLYRRGLSHEPERGLQDPKDYLEVLKRTLPPVFSYDGTGPKDVTGAGFGCTACAILPTTRDGTPVYFLPECHFSKT